MLTFLFIAYNAEPSRACLAETRDVTKMWFGHGMVGVPTRMALRFVTTFAIRGYCQKTSVTTVQSLCLPNQLMLGHKIIGCSLCLMHISYLSGPWSETKHVFHAWPFRMHCSCVCLSIVTPGPSLVLEVFGVLSASFSGLPHVGMCPPPSHAHYNSSARARHHGVGRPRRYRHEARMVGCKW